MLLCKAHSLLCKPAARRLWGLLRALQAADLMPQIIQARVTNLLLALCVRAAKFFWYLLFSYLTLLYFTFYGMMAVAVSPHVQLAAVISSAFYSVWFLFAGFLIPRPVSLISSRCCPPSLHIVNPWRSRCRHCLTPPSARRGLPVRFESPRPGILRTADAVSAISEWAYGF
jgi:hypothetical protein